MLSPSTAPRWKRQTRIGRETARNGAAGRLAAYAARARNSGSSPRLNSARPPDLTNKRLDIVIASSGVPCFPAPFRALPRSSPLNPRPPDVVAEGQRLSLHGIADIRQLPADDPLRVRRHFPPQD